MTVKELRDYLSKLPDNEIVGILVAGDGETYEVISPPEYDAELDQVVIAVE